MTCCRASHHPSVHSALSKAIPQHMIAIPVKRKAFFPYRSIGSSMWLPQVSQMFTCAPLQRTKENPLPRKDGAVGVQPGPELRCLGDDLVERPEQVGLPEPAA